METPTFEILHSIDELAVDQPSADYTILATGKPLAPIMHPESLRRIEANYQAWLRERRAGAASVEEEQQ